MDRLLHDLCHAGHMAVTVMVCRAAQSGGLWGPALLLARGISDAAFADAAAAMATATAVNPSENCDMRRLQNYDSVAVRPDLRPLSC